MVNAQQMQDGCVEVMHVDWMFGNVVAVIVRSSVDVATFDPRLQAAVVVESHDPETAVGDLISLNKNMLS